MKKEIILENYQNPKNKGLINNADYIFIKSKSKTCIDEIYLQMKIKDDIIEDIRFDGDACAICTSSTSIMTDILKGKTQEQALNIINNFEDMIEEKNYSEDVLGEAIVYSDISKQPNRKNCALLTWRGAKKILSENKK